MVLDVYGVVAGERLVAEGAERLQVALHRHEIEPAPEFLRVGSRVAVSARKNAISASTVFR